MAVTSHAKARPKPKKRTGRKMKPKKTVKRRSAPAASLADPRFRKRVVKSGRAYKRKGKTPMGEDEGA
jgi:hypothetical protein